MFINLQNKNNGFIRFTEIHHIKNETKFFISDLLDIYFLHKFELASNFKTNCIKIGYMSNGHYKTEIFVIDRAHPMLYENINDCKAIYVYDIDNFTSLKEYLS